MGKLSKIINAALNGLQQYGLVGLVLKLSSTLCSAGPSGLRGALIDLNKCNYVRWLRKHDTLTGHDKELIPHLINLMALKPVFSFVMSTCNAPGTHLRSTIESVTRQLYPHWELCIAVDASTSQDTRRVIDEYQAKYPNYIKLTFCESEACISAALNSALALATGEFVTLLDHEDELPRHALYRIALAYNRAPHIDLFYSDEDKINEAGQRYDPYFKPDWNPDLFTCQNLIGHSGVYRSYVLKDIRGFLEGYEGAYDWEMTLRFIERIDPSTIKHISSVLRHRRSAPDSLKISAKANPHERNASARALADHFRRLNQQVTLQPVLNSCWRVQYALPDPVPFVSLIIPTRNGYHLLRQCIESILEKTIYPAYEIIVVDNQSDDPETLAYMATITQDSRVRVIQYDAPFNYSAINNYAVQHSKGDIIGLINNDVEVINGDWLQEMASHASRKEIGAVGAMLYYPNDTIQHAGVILRLDGVAWHAYSCEPRGFLGDRGRACLTQNLSAVTAACLLVRRSTFEEVEGLDASNLSVLFNDVDLCLRIQERGYRNLWTPYAELYHHASATRGSDDSPVKQARYLREADYMHRRWGASLLKDPAYPSNQVLERCDFVLSFVSRPGQPSSCLGLLM
jgi:O-antigen biosynthesis protein